MDVRFIVIADQARKAINVLGSDYCEGVKHSVVAVPLVISCHYKGFLPVPSLHLLLASLVEIFKFNLFHTLK